MSITADQEKSALTNVNTQLFIGGEWREASGGATLDIEDPSTGDAIASVLKSREVEPAATRCGIEILRQQYRFAVMDQHR